MLLHVPPARQQHLSGVRNCGSFRGVGAGGAPHAQSSSVGRSTLSSLSTGDASTWPSRVVKTLSPRTPTNGFWHHDTCPSPNSTFWPSRSWFSLLAFFITFHPEVGVAPSTSL